MDKKDWGYLNKDQVKELMDKKGLKFPDLLQNLGDLLEDVNLERIDAKTLQNWLKPDYAGALQVVHAELIAEVLGVELREIFQPKNNYSEMTHERLVGKISGWSARNVAAREPLKVMNIALGLYKKYWSSFDLTPFLRRGKGIPWQNSKEDQFVYAVMTIKIPSEKGFRGQVFEGKNAFSFHWSLHRKANILQFLVGTVSVNNDEVSCYQPWLKWKDKARLTDNGEILIAFWLDKEPADFVLYHPNPKIPFELRVDIPADGKKHSYNKIFGELDELSRYSATELKEQLNKIGKRNYLVFPKQSQHFPDEE